MKATFENNTQIKISLHYLILQLFGVSIFCVVKFIIFLNFLDNI